MISLDLFDKHHYGLLRNTCIEGDNYLFLGYIANYCLRRVKPVIERVFSQTNQRVDHSESSNAFS